MIERTNWFQIQPLYQYIRQQAENKKFFKYIETSATFILITIFLFTAITPTATAISKLIGDIKSKEIITKNMSKKISSVLLAQENFALAQEKYQVLESAFPSKPNFYESASIISALSKETNTSISQLKFRLSDNDKKSDNNLNANLYNLTSTIEGKYTSLLDVIKKETNSRRLNEIKSLQISQNEEKGSSPNSSNLKLNISTDLFYLPVLSNEKK